MLSAHDSETNEIHSEIPWWVWEFCQDTTYDRVFFVPGGLFAGKTYGAAIKFLHMLTVNPESKNFWAVAPTHTKCWDILLPTLQEVAERHYGWLPGHHYDVLKQPPIRIRFPGERYITLHSGDRPHLMVGSNIAGWWLTEPGLQKREVFDKLNTRARCPRANCIQGICEGTPEGMPHWFEEVANEDRENYDKDGIDHLQNFRTQRVETADNPVDTEAYIAKVERIYSYDRLKLISYRDGRFTAFKQGTAYEFIQSRDIVLDVELSAHAPIILCFDFNHHPLAWTVLQKQSCEDRHRRYHRWVVLEEASGDETFLKDAVAEFIAKVPYRKYQNTPIYLYGDNSGWSGSHKSRDSDYDAIAKWLRPYYRKVEIHASRNNPRIRTTVEHVNKLLNYRYLAVAAWCRNTVTSFNMTSWKEGKYELDKPAGEVITHWSDSIRPAMYQITKHLNFEDPNAKIVYGKS